MRHAVEGAACGAGSVRSSSSPAISAPRSRLRWRGLAVRFVHNPRFRLGPRRARSRRASQRCRADAPGVGGLAGRHAQCHAAGDRPAGRGPSTRQPEALAVVPTLFGQRGNPVLLARALFPAVSLAFGRSAAHAGCSTRPARAWSRCRFDDPAIAIDVDTPEALRKALEG